MATHRASVVQVSAVCLSHFAEARTTSQKLPASEFYRTEVHFVSMYRLKNSELRIVMAEVDDADHAE